MGRGKIMSVRSGAAVCLIIMGIAGASGVSWAQAPGGAAAPAPTGGDPAAQAEWQSVIDLFSKANDDLNGSDRNLAAFIAASKLTPGGKAATSALVTRIDAARTNVLSSIDAAKLLAARPQATAADAARFRAANLPALTEATATTQAATAAVQNPAYVDHSDQDRAAAAQKAADAAAAKQAAAQAALAAQQAADQQRKDAEAARKAADAQAHSAAEAKAHADIDAKSGVVLQALKDQAEIAKQVSVALDALLIKNNLTSEARNAGIRLQRRVDANGAGRLVAQGKMSSLGDKPAAQAGAILAAVTADVNALGRDIVAVQAEEKALINSPKTFIGGIVPAISASAPTADPTPSATPAAPRLQDIVPVCDFTFEPADGKPMQIAIDGGPLRPLPTHARLASGRHTLSVRRNADAAERRELLLCGYVSTVPIEPIK
jgi:hypothetical protein